MTTTPKPCTMPEEKSFNERIQRALKHVQNTLNGLESNILNVDRTIADKETKQKALAKIDEKIDIFETLEVVCEEMLIQADLVEKMEGEKNANPSRK